MVRDDVAQVLADDAVALEVVVGDHERVIAGGLVGLDQAQGEVVEDVLFVGGGLRAAGGFGLGHARERKRVGGGCSAKSINSLPGKIVPPNKGAS
jgi:hypothetical protein